MNDIDLEMNEGPERPPTLGFKHLASSALRNLTRWLSQGRVETAKIVHEWRYPMGLLEFERWAAKNYPVPYEFLLCKDLLGDTDTYGPDTCVLVPRRWFTRFYRAIATYSCREYGGWWHVSCRWGSTHEQPPSITREEAEEAWFDEMMRWQEPYFPMLEQVAPGATKRIEVILRRVIAGDCTMGMWNRSRKGW